jgi:hypothetical protein
MVVERSPCLWQTNGSARDQEQSPQILLGAPARQAQVSPIYVVPNATRIQISGGWKDHCLTLTQSLKFLQTLPALV